MNVYFLSVGHRPFTKYVVWCLKAYMADCRVIQITDLDTKPTVGVDYVIREKVTGGLMLFMMKKFAEIQDDAFITTGDDCIINKPFHYLQYIHDDPYDVGIVHRTKPKFDKHGDNITARYPYTNGLVIVKNTQFYTDCYEWLLNTDDKALWGWFGDMAAIKHVLETGKYRIRKLPPKKFCVIPSRMGQVEDDAVMFHYAGKVRKGWIPYHGQQSSL